MKQKILAVISREWLGAALVSVVCFGVYLTTMCPTVSFIDAGELATVASLLGIAHPTGYPLFTLLTHCWLMIPFTGEQVARLNLFSALVVALSIGVFFKVLLASVRFANSGGRKGPGQLDAGRADMIAVAAIASLIFGFSATVWAQSVAVEVYGLHLLLILLTIFTLLESLARDVAEAGGIPRKLILSAFLLGLSFTNHLTTLLVVPGVIFLYFRSTGFDRSSLIRLRRLAVYFCFGLTPYLSLVIRARLHPPVEWGSPVSLERLLWHVSGKQYRSWMFSSFDSAEKQLSYFVSHFSSEYSWVVIIVMLAGIWRVYRFNRTLFWFLVIAFVSCLTYSINYDIHDIDSYFLLAYVVAGVLAFYGLCALLEFLRRARWAHAVPVALIFMLALPGVQVLDHRKDVSESDNHLTDDYTHNILKNVEPRALIISYQWDYFVAPSLYFQLVRGERPDVAVVDKELLRRSWYFINLKNRYPWLIARSQEKVDAFLSELYKFEHDIPYDPRIIEARYVEMINDFIDQSFADRPVYIGPELEPEFAARYIRVPDGLVFRLQRPEDTLAIRPLDIEFRHASIESRLTHGLEGLAVKMLTATAARFAQGDRRADAVFCVEKALSIDPSYQPAKTLKLSLGAGSAVVK